MTPAQILTLIAAQITTNGVGGITGAILNNILTQIVNLFTTNVATPRIVSSSANFAFLLTDYRVGLLRTLSITPMTVTIPAGLTPGQELILQDLAGNFSQYNVTVVPPAGMTFSGGRLTYVMNEDNQTARFAFYGQNIFGVEPA